MSDYNKGLLITIAGVIALIPDSILLRLAEVDLFVTIFYRGFISFLTVSVFYFALSPRKSINDFKSLSSPHLFMMMFMASSNITFITAVEYTSVANTLFILSTSPIFSAIISRLFLKEHISLKTIITIFTVFIGIFIMVFPNLFQRGSSSFSIIGDFAALCSSLSLALLFCTSRYVNGSGVIPVVSIGSLLSALFAIIFVDNLVIESMQSIIAIIALGTIVTPLGFCLLNYGPRFLPAPQVGLILLLEAVCAPILAWIIFHEYPGDYTIIGGFIVISALAISSVITIIYSPNPT